MKFECACNRYDSRKKCSVFNRQIVNIKIGLSHRRDIKYRLCTKRKNDNIVDERNQFRQSNNIDSSIIKKNDENYARRLRQKENWKRTNRYIKSSDFELMTFNGYFVEKICKRSILHALFTFQFYSQTDAAEHSMRRQFDIDTNTNTKR